MRTMAVITVSLLLASSAEAGSGTLGLMGDSLSDEYLEDTYSYAYNWVEQLSLYAGVDVGPTAEEAGQSGGTWGEPRRSGYEYNWARSGATSGSLLDQGQHTGLAAQVEPQGIGYAVLAIGSNDFHPADPAYFKIYNGYWTEEDIQNYVDQIVANIDEALVTVLPTGVELVVANVLDYGIVPAVWRNPVYDDPDKREQVTTVIRTLNRRLEDLARDHGLVLFDALGLANGIFGSNHEPYEFLTIGNVIIYLWETDTETNDNPQAGFVHDGIHPHTHIQGIFANMMLEGLNVGYGAAVPLFSEEEILAHAGLPYGGEDTLPAQLGDYRDYLVNFALPGDLDSDGFVDMVDLLKLLAAWGACEDPTVSCRADLDGDHIVDDADLMVLLGNWTA